MSKKDDKDTVICEICDTEINYDDSTELDGAICCQRCHDEWQEEDDSWG